MDQVSPVVRVIEIDRLVGHTVRQGCRTRDDRRGATSAALPQFVQRHGAKPTPETLPAVVDEFRQLAEEEGQDFLDEIGGIGFLESRTAGSVIEQWRVEVHELRPSLRIGGPSQSLQQAGGRFHADAPRRADARESAFQKRSIEPRR